jgi:hypothetical protein
MIERAVKSTLLNLVFFYQECRSEIAWGILGRWALLSLTLAVLCMNEGEKGDAMICKFLFEPR